jgi:hypothetical protein
MIPNFEVLNEWIGIFGFPVNLKRTYTCYLERFLNMLFHKSFLGIFVGFQIECVVNAEFEKVRRRFLEESKS